MAFYIFCENVKGIQRVADQVSGLAVQSSEAAKELVGATHINDVVQTNSAASEECAAASQEMSR